MTSLRTRPTAATILWPKVKRAALPPHENSPRYPHLARAGWCCPCRAGIRAGIADLACAASTEMRALRTAAELERCSPRSRCYPDALIALILPATTAPADIVLAARHVRENPNDRSQIRTSGVGRQREIADALSDVLKWLDGISTGPSRLAKRSRSSRRGDGSDPAAAREGAGRGTLVSTPQQAGARRAGGNSDRAGAPDGFTCPTTSRTSCLSIGRSITPGPFSPLAPALR